MGDEQWIYNMVEEKIKLERASIEEQWKLRETRMQETLRLERIELENRWKQFETGILTQAMRMLQDPIPVPNPKNMELLFLNKICQPISTGEEIKGMDSTFIELILLDSSTRAIVDAGPIASSSVEIVALENGADDPTAGEFEEKIVRVEGKLPLLVGNVCKLEGGRGVLRNVKFRHHATDVKPPVFRLGARVAEKFDGIIVKEAKTESFEVESYRRKYSKKIEFPNLESKIWELKNIQRRGKIHERLKTKGIDTVGKFLIQLLINHQELQNTVGLKGKKWEATVSHAKKCQSDRMYCYINSHENSSVVFDICGKLQGLCSEGQYAAANMLSENKKVYADKLLSYALEHWENVTPFDDLNSLQQHMAAIKASFKPSSSGTPGHRDANPDTGTSTMIGSSIDGKFLNPLLDHPGNLNAGVDTSVYNGWFGTDDLGYMVDSPLWADPYSDMDLGRILDDSDIGCVVYGYGMQQQEFVDDMNIIASMDETGIMLAESDVIASSSAVWRKYRMLFRCLSKWRKMSKFEANPAWKKQKICCKILV
ncbi:calmodulin-binding protein 60 A-like isoform X2 [Primulina eburnea]|uniref:calmodulin-binding protein 60 A-like isoform X2 n=2 Tax=Primulina eburnea TaxID=1245227 RepID=UPI003C6BE8AE